MALGDIKMYKQLFDTHQEERDRRAKLDYLKQQNDEKKLRLEEAKIEGQFQKDRADIKAVSTDTLNKELENKAKKQELLDKAKKQAEEEQKRLEELKQQKEKEYEQWLKDQGFEVKNQQKPALKDLLTRQTPVKQASFFAGYKALWDKLTTPRQNKDEIAKAKEVKAKGKQQEIDIDQIIADNPLPESPSGVATPDTEPVPPAQATPFEPPEPIPMPSGRLSVPAPPIPDTRSTREALEAQKESILAGIETREHIQKQQEAVTSAFKESQKQYRRKMVRNLELQRKLSENPPTYRQAVSNVGLFGQIIGIIDAGMHGHLYENPTQLLDGLIEKEMADQVSRYKTGSDYLKTQRSMYNQFYDLSKDEFEAESSTKALLYKGVADQIDSYSKLAVTEQQMATLGNLKKEVMYKHGMEVAKMQQAGQQKAFDNAVKMAGLNIKQYEAETKRLKTQGKEGLGLSPKERVDRRVRFGGEDFYDIPKGILDKKEGVRDTLKSSKKTVRGAYDLERTANTITKGAGVRSLFAGLPFTDYGEKDRAKFETLNKGMIKLMLKSRIEFTGGGNMSDAERAYLEQFYESKKGVFVLKNTQKITKILMGLGRGDYETLFKILKKDAFFNALTEMQQSPTFSQMNNREQQFGLTAKELGINKKDMADYLNGVDYK